MRRRRRHMLRDERGAAAVEFAVVGPVAIMMIFGVIESGRLMFMLNAMQAGLSTASRQLMIDPDATETELKATFCDRAVLVTCSEVVFDMTAQTVDGQQWQVLTATVPFGSPIAGLLPLPATLTRTDRTPYFAAT